MVINHWVVINKATAMRDGKTITSAAKTPEDVYRIINCNYPKFFKMDLLCKWAFVASELLLASEQLAGSDKNKVSLALATNHGCLDVDKKYFETIDMPSPALFVYTLPNIMLGEICIRNGFKGEQVCIASEQFDAAEMHFAVSNFLVNKQMDACLCGWVDISLELPEIMLCWVSRKGTGYDFTPQMIQELAGH
jgi:hypothetical protein